MRFSITWDERAFLVWENELSFFSVFLAPFTLIHSYHLFQIDLVQKRRKIKKFDDGIDHNVHVIGGRWESENEF